jgi:hypothetical protein
VFQSAHALGKHAHPIGSSARSIRRNGVRELVSHRDSIPVVVVVYHQDKSATFPTTMNNMVPRSLGEFVPYIDESIGPCIRRNSLTSYADTVHGV